VGDEVLEQVAKKAIIVRMLHNLLGIARRDQDTDAGLRYLDGILRLDPSDGQSRMMRAGIYLSKHQKAEALADVQYLIDHPTPGLDLKRLKEFKERLEEEKN
jgi:regulator of sirC expression with transglutaminase-like and TPR domain